MYLHIGGDVVVAFQDLVAIIDVTSMERESNNQVFLKKAGERGYLELMADSPTNSWVITTRKIYASPISANTLRKRAGYPIYLEEEET